MDSDFDWSDFDWSDFNSRYPGLTLNSSSSFPSTFYKIYHLLPGDGIYQSSPRNTLSEMYIVNFTTVNTPHISPHVSPRNVVMQGPVKFT